MKLAPWTWAAWEDGLYTDLETNLPLGVDSVLRPQQHGGQDGEELQAHVRVCGGLETGPEGGDHVLQRLSHSWACNRGEGMPQAAGCPGFSDGAGD